MAELISNGERLSEVRAKLNATLRPYASREEFEGAPIPEAVTLVNVIDAGQIVQLVRDDAGDWVSSDGAKWRATVLAAIAVEDLQNLTDTATIAASAASGHAVAAQDAAGNAAGFNASAQAAAASSQASVASAAGIVSLAWSPRDLLRDGSTGIYLMPLDPAAGNVWTDTARTTLATAAGQRPASVRMATESGFLYAEQATLANRPYLGRYPDGGRRQLLLNSALSGAVVGTPGTLPTGWAAFGGTIATQVVGVGTDANGAAYLDLRVTGAPGGSGIINLTGASGVSDVPTADGETRTFGFSAQVVSGSLANVTRIAGRINFRTSGGSASVAFSGESGPIDASTYQRLSVTATASGGTVAVARAQISLICTGAVDFTLRIGGVQVESGAAATTWQRVPYTAGLPAYLDVTEAGKRDTWYLLRSGASVSLPVTLPGYGAAATVMRSTDLAASVVEGQTVGAGAYEALGADGSLTVALSILSRAVTDAESALALAWMDRQRGFIATGSSASPLPGAAKAAATVAVRQDGADYSMTIARIASEIGGAVTPAMFGGDPTGLAASDAAVAAALATGAPVMLDGEYRLTAQLNTPAYSLLFLKNPNCGIIADMGQTPAIVLGNGSRVPSLRVRSQAFPVSAIANDANWNLWSRSVRAGNDCQFGVMWLDGLAGGLDLTSVTDCEIGVVYASNMRSRYGWAAGLHIAGGGRHRVGRVGVSQSDRGCEVEMGAVDVTIRNYLFESIYPNGYTGAPADGTGSTNYLRTSWSGPNVHSHVGEPSCRDIRWGDGVVRDCVNPINIQSSASSDATTYPESVSVGRVVIDSPRVASTQTFKEVVSLCGRGMHVDAIEFRGTPAALIDAMVSTWGSFSEDITIGSIKARAGAWYGRMTQFAVPESRLLGYDIATQDTTDTTRRANPMHNVAAGARNFVFGPGVLRSPQYHAALFHAQGGSTPSGGRRVGTRIIAAGSNPPAAVEAASFAALDAYRADNVGG